MKKKRNDFLFIIFNLNKGLSGSRALGLLPEQVIWDYVIQLTSLIRTIHSANLACRILTSSRILIDHKSRIRLSGCGILDVIEFENSAKNIAIAQVNNLFKNKNSHIHCCY